MSTAHPISAPRRPVGINSKDMFTDLWCGILLGHSGLETASDLDGVCWGLKLFSL